MVYLGETELAILVALVQNVKPTVMIEIGCQLGRTAKVILNNVPTLVRYVGIDVPWSHQPTLACQRSETPALPGLYAKDDPRFYLYLQPTQTIPELEQCDAVFIDGDHSSAAVLHDSHLAFACVRPGGIIVWHDVGNTGVEVTPVIDQFITEGWPIEKVPNTWLAYWCRPRG